MSDRIPSPGKVPPGKVPPRKKTPSKTTASNVPPPGRVPPSVARKNQSARPAGWTLAAIVGIFAVLLTATAVWVTRDDSTPPTEVAQSLTGTPSEVIDVDATEPPPTPLPSPTFPPEETPTAGPTQPVGVCNPLCLARMPSGEGATAFLAEFGAKPTYEHGDQTWLSLDNRMLAQLEAEGKEFALVEDVSDSSRLYVMRLPDGVDRSWIDDMGTVVDGVDNQFIVDIPGPPPYVLDIIEHGHLDRKAAALASGDSPGSRKAGDHRPRRGCGKHQRPAAQAARSPICNRWAPIEGALGSREYSQPATCRPRSISIAGSASYGLNVWYEDFIGDNGRLLLNVVGEIPGRDSSKIYLMTAHFDSIADDTKDPALAPGALDNATGLSVLLETARALSGYQPRASGPFRVFQREEYAMQGAHAFAHNAEHRRITARMPARTTSIRSERRFDAEPALRQCEPGLRNSSRACW